MPFGRRALILPLIVLAALLANGMARADDLPRPPGSIPTKNSSTRAAGPTITELPPSALGMDTQSRGYEPGEEKSDLKLPDQIKLGNNTLHFDAKKQDPTPPVGFEANGEAVINKAPAEPALKPNYFGLRLTAPIR